MSRIQLFHTGYDKIPEPDIHYGRANADFGQGFYLSDSEEFSKRWARARKGLTTYINCYEPDTAGLNIRNFMRDEEWFGYIYREPLKTVSAYCAAEDDNSGFPPTLPVFGGDEMMP